MTSRDCSIGVARGLVRRGFSLVEALVVAIVLATTLASILTFLYHSQVWSTRSTEQAQSLGELRIALARMTHEIREGRQLVYPAAGRRSQPGVGVVNARGEVVFYRLERSPDGPPATPYDLIRERVGGKKEVVLRRVTRMLATTVDLGPGREPALVRLIVSRALGNPEVPGDVGVSLLSSAAVRAVRTRCAALR